MLLGSGGAAGIGVTRALKKAGHSVIGTDSSDQGMLLSEAHTTYPLPRAHGFTSALWHLLADVNPDLTIAQPDECVFALSRIRHTIRGYTRYMLPSHSVVDICQDKWLSYLKWKEAGIAVPETQLVRGREAIFALTGAKRKPAWMRPRRGAGGRGSFKAQTPEEGREWMNHVKGWGEYTIASCLTDKTVTWQSLWRDGELIASQQRRRLSWANAGSTTTGVSGSTGIGETCYDEDAAVVGVDSVFAIDPKPHGLYGVDMAYDDEGYPNPTEINVGRFFTTSPEFFTACGFNMADLYVRTAMGQEVERKFNPIPNGKKWVRAMDKAPVLV